jgi:hypothetical protein
MPPSPTRGEGNSIASHRRRDPVAAMTRLASSVPSSFFTAPKMMIFASSWTVAATKVTIGVPRHDDFLFAVCI